MRHYSRLLVEYRKATTVSIVNGRAVRVVASRFEVAYRVSGTGPPFGTRAEAEAFARALPQTADEVRASP